MSVSASNGAKFYIGTSVAATDAASYAADTYTEVKNVMDIDEYGDDASEIKYEVLGTNRAQRLPGTRDAGTTTVSCANDNSDAGQNAMKTAAALPSPVNMNFKIVLNDQGGGTHPTTAYFSGMVMSSKRKIGKADSVVTVDFKIAVNTGLTEVLAA